MKRQWWKTLVAAALVLVLAAGTAVAATVYVSKDGGSLNLRAGKGTSYEITGYAVHGESVTVLENSGEWSKVMVDRTGKVGYIRSSYIRDAGATVYVSKDGGSLNLRAGKGTNYEITGYAVHGESVTVLENDGEWSKIRVERTGKVGYVRSSYIRGSSTPPPSGGTSKYEPALLMTKTVDGSVHLRSGAGSGYQSLGTLKRGDFLKAIGRSGDWIQVVTTNKKTGYVHKSYVSFGVGARTTGDVNFRKGPGTNYPVIRALSTGTGVTVLEIDGKWAKVRAGSATGYISTSYFRF
jgi:uncharacterized protein YgiM (DUF1202 family)